MKKEISSAPKSIPVSIDPLSLEVNSSKERITKIEQEGSSFLSPEKMRSQKREQVFLAVVFDQLLDIFEEDLYDAGAQEEDIDYFRHKVEKKTQEEILGILSLPKDIRTSLFAKKFSESPSGNVAIDMIIQTAVDAHHRYGFTLGYHVSQKEIEPTKKGWLIKATEFDDRDEMKMAYYSVDYEHFYRKKPAKWIYFVRAETGNNSAHRLDNDNRWSRATALSVVGKVSLRETDELVDQLMKDLEAKSADQQMAGTAQG